LFLWVDRKLKQVIPGHNGTITAMTQGKNKEVVLMTGGNDGMLVMWDKSFKKSVVLNIAGMKMSRNPKIRAIDQNYTGDIIIGTRGGEIIELKEGQVSKGRLVVQGHFEGEVWGLAASNAQPEFATFGEDNLLAVWSAKDHEMKRGVLLPKGGLTCAYTPDRGSQIAAGCSDGSVVIVEASSLKQLQTISDRTSEVTVVAYSPGDEFLAAGGADGKVHIYEVATYKQIAKCVHGSPITHVDFSKNGQYIQTQCEKHEIMHFETKTGKRVMKPSQFKDEAWATWSLTLGWQVQGIWSSGSTGTEMNACARSHKGTILATGDDYSKVKLFKYPAPVIGSSFVKYVGHSSHVTNLAFTANDEFLVSVGGCDKSIFQWRFNHDETAEEEAAALREEGGEEQVDVPESAGGVFESEEVGEGDQALAVKPFLGQVKASVPTGYKMPANAGEKPDQNLSLSYCHGYRCFDAVGTAAYNASNHIVFAAAALGVVMNPDTLEQKFFQEHQEDIIAFAVHPEKKIAATGQMAQKGKAKMIDLFGWATE
jgi:microtubule-associated protein-like 6